MDKEGHPHRATIPTLPDGVGRPMWSVMIPTYNCAKYLREALASVLSQDPGPEVMQIEVVDDHSSADEPGVVVEEMTRGRVSFFRQPQNVGIIRNFETCLRRSQGRLIHLLHGDDYVLDGFYAAMQRAFSDGPLIGAGFCRHIFMDEQGHWQALSALEQQQSGILKDWLVRIASEQRIMTPSMVVRREVYEALGGFDARLACSEDWEMWVRIAARYPIWYEVKPLAVYRMHPASNTGRHLRRAEHLRYTRRAIEIFTAYLPYDISAKLSNAAKRTYALSALDMAYTMVQKGELSSALAHVREALRLRRSPRVLAGLLWLAARVAAFGVRRLLGPPRTSR